MKDPHDMTDDELEAAFLAAKAERDGTQTSTEEEVDVTTNVDDDTVDTSDDYTTEADTTNDGDDEESDSDNTSEEDTSEAETETDTDTTKVEGDKEKTAGTEVAVAPVQHKFKANGKEYEITDEEMKEQFPRIFGQAMDYTRKMQAIKPWRKTIDAIEQAKLQHDDVNLMIDVFKGNKAAISELLKRTGVDALDLNPDEATYTKTDYGRDGTALDIQDVLSNIRNDEEYRITHNVLSSWDDESFRVLSEDPKKIELLHVDVKSGLYATLAPIAEKLKVFDNARKSDLDYYFDATRKFVADRENEQLRERQLALQTQEQNLAAKTRVAQVQSEEQKRAATKEAAVKRKAAAPTGRTVGNPGKVDYLNSSEEDFEEWYKKLEER